MKAVSSCTTFDAVGRELVNAIRDVAEHQRFLSKSCAACRQVTDRRPQHLVRRRESCPSVRFCVLLAAKWSKIRAGRHQRTLGNQP